MSYDISYRVKIDGADEYVPVGDCEANTTWNLRDMIVNATGLEWKNEASNGLCKDVIPFIVKGYSELLSYPEKYKQYEASNGWGTVEGCRKFFYDIIVSWESFVKDHPKWKDYAVFWID